MLLGYCDLRQRAIPEMPMVILVVVLVVVLEKVALEKVAAAVAVLPVTVRQKVVTAAGSQVVTVVAVVPVMVVAVVPVMGEVVLENVLEKVLHQVLVEAMPKMVVMVFEAVSDLATESSLFQGHLLGGIDLRHLGRVGRWQHVEMIRFSSCSFLFQWLRVSLRARGHFLGSQNGRTFDLQCFSALLRGHFLVQDLLGHFLRGSQNGCICPISCICDLWGGDGVWIVIAVRTIVIPLFAVMGLSVIIRTLYYYLCLPTEARA